MTSFKSEFGTRWTWNEKIVYNNGSMNMTNEQTPESKQPVTIERAGEADEIALHRAEIARLRGVLHTIADYPDVESDMDVWHIVSGMTQQAQNALEADPPKSGL